MIDFGNFIAKEDGSFIVFAKPEEKGSGYHVVDRSIDPYCRFSLADVEEYAREHPEKEVPFWKEVVSDEQLANEIRAMRDGKILEIRWRIDRHNDEKMLGIATTEPLEPLLWYIQRLRDITQQEGFPRSVVWPEVP